MRMLSLAVLALLIGSAGVLFADRAPPPPKEPTYPLVIEPGKKVLEAKLIIPQKMLGKIKTAFEEDAEQGAAATSPPLHTVMAGGSLALALAFSGLWLVKRGHVNGRALALMMGSVAFLGIGAMVWADLRPPQPKGELARTDKVIIEIVEKGDEIKLIINEGKLAKLLQQQEKK